MSGEIPKVVSAGTKTHWELSNSSTYGQSWESKEGIEISFALFVGKNSRVRITVDYFEGELSNLPYTAKIKYFLDNGQFFKYGRERCIQRGIHDPNRPS